MSGSADVDHLFRHEYGPLVALLSRRLGIANLDAIEDAVQWAMMQAMEHWTLNKKPDNPAAWLYKVAYRQLVSELRTQKRRTELLAQEHNPDDKHTTLPDAPPLPGELGDSLLKMLFVACQDNIPIESQLVFTLKSLCGFSIREIAIRLFITEANVYKRFSRAKESLKQGQVDLDSLTNSEATKRLPAVHHIIYLMFTEGYLSSDESTAIRQDLCDEAIRLAQLLAESQVGNTPVTAALLALMHLNQSRLNTRQDNNGALLLLEQQDRSQWDQQQIALGVQFLEQSAQGDHLSRYHVEASIAAEHCLAPSFEQTRWDKIVAAYELLDQFSPSLMNQLNRAVAMAEYQGPNAGLELLQSIELPPWLDRTYQWQAVMSDLHYRCNQLKQAKTYAEQAIQAAPTEQIKQLLQKRFSRYKNT